MAQLQAPALTTPRPPPPPPPPGQAAPPAAKPDSLASLLSLLAATYGMHPELFLDDSLRYEVFGTFMEEVAGGAAITAVPSAFLAYLEVRACLLFFLVISWLMNWLMDPDPALRCHRGLSRS